MNKLLEYDTVEELPFSIPTEEEITEMENKMISEQMGLYVAYGDGVHCSVCIFSQSVCQVAIVL